MRGWRAPNACEASGATADTMPMPTVKAANSTVCASAVAATTWSPRRPSSIRSVVIMATWPSWVTAIGQARRIVSMISARQAVPGAGSSMPAAMCAGCEVMAAT
jgi:hypothetical protein